MPLAFFRSASQVNKSALEPKTFQAKERALMEFKLILAVVAIITNALRTIAVPTVYVVGDEKGWDLEVNYTAWAEGKEFRVGDTLVFKYTFGDHNVIEVSWTEFEACKVSKTATALTSGNDTITLKAAGKAWYLCGKKNHCNLGQKLVVPILPSIIVESGAQGPNPATPPASGLSNKISCKHQLLMVVVGAMIML